MNKNDYSVMIINSSANMGIELSKTNLKLCVDVNIFTTEKMNEMFLRQIQEFLFL